MPRTALVTGGNRGIGLEVCRQLAAAGHHVVLTARDPARAAAAAGALGVRAEQLDVTDPDSVTACAQRLAAAGVAVDVLVNNAGVYPGTPVLLAGEAELTEAFQINALGVWRTCRAFVPLMRDRGWGRVVAVSTASAQMGGSPPAAAAWSKTALNALTRIVAAEAGPRVLVNAADPGWVATGLGGSDAPTSPAEGADTVVWLATLPDDGPTGGFWHRRQRIPW
jgi:NAD(P)-dependent dehydrogenase (short-subunit alcohol dehydrogenase family)